MQFSTLLSVALASVASATALPKTARAVDPALTCQDPTQGPLLNQFDRAIFNLGYHGEDVFCLPSPGVCARVETYGTAGLNLCGASKSGAAATCFKYKDLAPFFRAIADSCAGEDKGIWTRANGWYTIDKSKFPEGTIWAAVYTEAIGPLGP